MSPLHSHVTRAIGKNSTSGWIGKNIVNQPLSLDEAVKLGAIDDDFFGSYFFPRTFRFPHPTYSKQVQAAFDDRSSRYVALKMYRDSSKTVRSRTRIAKHISYALSRCVMLVSNAQKHSIFSLKWLRRQVEYNTLWAKAFDLSKGTTWSDEVLEIRHGIGRHSIFVLAFGITGQIRGVNPDDWRPDFILLDDPDNEETTATIEQREKTSNLVFGALKESLAPPTEAPLAKLAILQTPLAQNDVIDVATKDEAFRSVTVSCFDDKGESSWPERFPTDFLRAEKDMHIRLNKLSLWMREKECKLVSPETSSFRETWLGFWDVLPEKLEVVIPIDPASSASKTADDQVVAALGFYKGNVYVIEYRAERGDMPDAAAAYLFDLIFRLTRQGHWVRKVTVESISYQRILAWYLEKRFAEQRRWIQVDKIEDRRKKSDRIIQELTAIAPNGRLFVHKSHTKFIQQFVEFSPHREMHDDVLDAVCIGLMSYRARESLEGDFSRITEEEKDIPALTDWRTCP